MEQEKTYRLGEIEEILSEMDFSEVDDDIRNCICNRDYHHRC